MTKPIVDIFRDILQFAKWLTPMRWFSPWIPMLRARSELKSGEFDDENFMKARARVVEKYLKWWFFLEAVIVVSACVGTAPRFFYFVAIPSMLLASLRIIEIVQVTTNAALFDAVRGRPDELVISHLRMITLAIVNFVELMLCFGVIYAADYGSLKGAGKPITAFYFSVITQLTIGYGDVYPTGWLRVVAAIQGCIGFAFVALILADS